MFKYIWDILVGTATQLRSLAMVFSHGFRKRDTLQYPEEQVYLPPRYRGRIVLTRDPDGEERCVAWGGHLASVESLEEDAFLGAWPALVGIGFWDGSGLWLGGTDARADGDFRWSDDRALSYVGWASDQPNNGQGIDCIEKRNDPTQRWYDRRCVDGERYVCERPQ